MPAFRSDNHRPCRRGFLSAELALVLPILAIVLFSLFQFSLLFHARGQVVAASRTGARMASLPGVGPETVEEHALRVLSQRLQANARVYVAEGSETGDTVVVAVRVPMRQAAPDLLWPIGLGLGDRDLYAETTMIRE